MISYLEGGKFVMKHIPIKTENVLLAGYYGSSVYGTANQKSDLDVLIVANNMSFELKLNDVDYQIISVKEFVEKLNNHHISALELFYLTNDKVIYEKEGFRKSLNFTIDIKKLRHSLSQTASNSFVKAKKKITHEKNLEYVGLKSLFHSLRILNFGIQMATYGKIIDYTSANCYYYDIINSEPEWQNLKEKYQPIYNQLSSEFRKVTIK